MKALYWIYPTPGKGKTQKYGARRVLREKKVRFREENGWIQGRYPRMDIELITEFGWYLANWANAPTEYRTRQEGWDQRRGKLEWTAALFAKISSTRSKVGRKTLRVGRVCGRRWEVQFWVMLRFMCLWDTNWQLDLWLQSLVTYTSAEEWSLEILESSAYWRYLKILK